MSAHTLPASFEAPCPKCAKNAPAVTMKRRGARLYMGNCDACKTTYGTVWVGANGGRPGPPIAKPRR
jgi:hypothetical protein